MEIQGIIDAVVEHVKDAPEKIKDFVADPSAAIERITGDKLDMEAAGEVAKGVIAKIKEGGGDAIEGIEDFMKEGAGHDVIEGIGEKLGGVGSKIGDAVGGIFGKKDDE